VGEVTDEAGEHGDAGWEIHGVAFRRAAGTRCGKLVLCSDPTVTSRVSSLAIVNALQTWHVLPSADNLTEQKSRISVPEFPTISTVNPA
jgi:hypothetical protein